MNNALKDKTFILSFFGIFLFCQILSLIISIHLIPQNLQLTIIDKNPNSVWNAVFIVGYIIFFTIVILILKKFFKSGNFLFIIETLALFSGISLVFSLVISPFLSYLATIFLLIVKYTRKEETIYSKWYNNLLLGVAISGAATIMGLSLGIIPVIVLLTLLAIYDIIAVFYTKHMVTLANMIITKKVSLIFLLPSKKREYKLGGGDIVIPAVVSTSLFMLLIKTKTMLFSILAVTSVWLASIVGLFITFYILDRYKAKIKALPALPIQVVLMIFVILIYLI
ncbi:MAG TPA: presenilin family intramembrane aspartyl protease [archaeon]|jgi:presenilin-like A22 family membrane protease|nr:presenilin family intramembrane aspartyl protease [archaeon]